MIDRDERLAGRKRHALARHQPDQDAADEARPGRGGDAVELAGADAGLRERAGDQPIEISTWARAAISGTTPP